MRSLTSKCLTKALFLLIVLLSSIVVGFGLQTSLMIPSSGAIYYPPETKILFDDGFESGNSSTWNGTYSTPGDNVTVTMANPYDGDYHGLLQTAALTSGIKYAYFYQDLSPTANEVYARCYFYINEGLPLDDNDDRMGLIGFEIGGQLQSTLRIYRQNNNDKFSITGFNGTSSISQYTDDIYPAEKRWYCLEFHIRVHATIGEYKAWINGVERISITNIDTTLYGNSVSRVRFGLTYTANVQHYVEVHCDSAVIATSYIGQLRYIFGVIGTATDTPAISNLYWLFGNQSMSYRSIPASEVTNLADIDRFDGLVVMTKQGEYNATAVRIFAETHVVIADIRDFCGSLYPTLAPNMQTVSTGMMTYVRDWGNFRSGDLVATRNETGNVDQLMSVLASGLSTFTNVTIIARYDINRIALFCMNGTLPESGFYVMDLDATTPETEWNGIWHLFPAIKLVKDFPTGKYALWMANGKNWWNLTWVYSYIDKLVSENIDIVSKSVIGSSVQGNEIRAMTIGKGSRYAIIDGAIHGNEKTGVFACLRIAELLIQYYRSDSYWRSRLTEYKVIIIPVLNPDGFIGNTRYNYNGKDLNSQFPPESNTTEPEAWALRNLMGNYTPTIYVNIHEGWYWYPLDMLYGNHETSTNRTLTINALRQANSTFVSLGHWGWFSENHSDVWVGKVDAIYQGGKGGMAVSYASYTYQASCMLTETFVWSQTWGARKCLWGIEYYTTVILAFLQNIQR